MNIKEFEKYINRYKVEMFLKIRNSAPYKSGMLKAGIRLQNNIDGFSILSTVPYMKYTEERWRKDFTKDGRENPNLYWFKEAAEKAAEQARRELNG